MWNYWYHRFVKDFMSYFFFPALMVAGIQASGIHNTGTVTLALLSNYALMVISFLYNDIEDRTEDSQSPGKRFKNPFGYNIMSIQKGYFLILCMASLALSLSYYLGGWKLSGIALSNIAIGILYSYKKIRLKSVPVIDLLSHSYLLASVQILYFMNIKGAYIHTGSLFVLIGVTCISVGGSLYNQYRDFKDDQNADINNTANMIGRNYSFLLSKVFWSMGFAITMFGFIK